MSLGPYRVGPSGGSGKQHVFPEPVDGDTATAPCGVDAAVVNTELVSRYDFVEADLNGEVCKRCLYLLDYIPAHDATIAVRLD